MLTLFYGLKTERHNKKGEKHYIQLVIACCQPSKILQATKQSLSFVSAIVKLAVIFPWLKPVAFGRDNGNMAKAFHKLSRLVSLICTIHHHKI